jgi:tetratricopeptide (TPR) repeat protein
MNAGDTAGALRVAEEWTRIAPQSAASFGFYGGLLQQLHRYADAEAQYRKGMQLLPAHADYGSDAASSLAEMLMLRGRTADARAVTADALSRAAEPTDSAMYMAEMAGTYFASGDNRRAMQLLEQARQKSETIGGGSNPFPFDYVLAEASAMTGDLTSMRNSMARLRLQTPNDTALYFANYANNYAYLGQLDSALAYTDRLARFSGVPWSAGYAHHLRGVAFAAAKQCGRARTELAQAPDTASLEVRVTQAECELQLGNRAAALALRDRAIASQDFVLFDPAYVRQRQRLAQMK